LTPRKPVRRTASTANPFDEKPEFLTDTVFLIGNGTSRNHFDLERLRGRGTIIGCNALYRDFAPDLLVAIDAKMLREIKTTDYATNNVCVIPPNRSVAIPNAIKWRSSDKYNTSGCYAMLMIAEAMKSKYCFMIGMDGFPGNLYDKTANYAANTLQNFKGVLNYYLQTLQGEGETRFVNVNEQDAWPQAAHETGKYTCITYDKFEELVMV